MSAFAVSYQPSSSETLDCLEGFERVMERLSHRGPHGEHTVSVDHIRMGYWQFWTTPEETYEYQPLKLDDLPFRIVFDGRIDNREEMFASLGISSGEGKTISDTALTLHAYARWGEGCFEKFIGEFALVIFNEQLHEIIAVRDPLGDRTLFYAFFGTQLVIASEPWAVAGASPWKPAIEESAVAHYFALQIPPDGRTFFKNIYELLPAHILKVSATDRRSWRYWSPDPDKNIRYKSDEEYASHFRSLLEESVRSRMRSSLAVGVLMSGGLDSTSVACLAARAIAPKTLTTVSYVFDEFAECDERQYIEAIKEKYGIHSIQIPCDDVWTFKNWENWPYNPNNPGGNVYRMILERVYERARQEGIQILLTGYMGDHLYSAGGDWIADLIVDRQFSKAWKELAFQIKSRGWQRTLNTGHFRRTARRVVDTIRPGAIRFSRQASLPPWINPTYKSCFTSLAMLNPVFERHGSLLNLETSNDLAHTFRNTNRYQIELRNPFRDRRLIEFILAIPAYQLYYHGMFKHILRIAMQNILPEIVRTRSGKTSFISLYHQGMEREQKLLDFCLKDPKAEWRKFVHADWSSKMSSLIQVNSKEGLLPFLCVAYQAWYQDFVSKNLSSV